MGKSSKKSTKVDAAPAVVVAPTKSALKKGKREAEVAIENLASAKKQKKDVVAEQKVETKIQKKIMSKKEESSSSEDISSSESDEERKVKETPKKGGIQAKPTVEESSDNDDSSSDEDVPVKAVVPSNGNVPASKGKVSSSSSDDESESESEEDEKPKGKVAIPSKKLPVPSAKNGNAPAKKAETRDDSGSDDSDSSDDDDEVVAAPPKKKMESSDSDSESEEDEAPAAKVVPSKRLPSAAETKKKTVAKASDSGDSSSESSDESDDEEPQMKKMKAQPTATINAVKQNTKAPLKESSSDEDEESSDDEPTKTQMVKKVSKKESKSDEESEEDSSSEEETSEEEEASKTTKKSERDVEMVDAVSPKTNVKSAKKAAQSPFTPQVQTGGPKTLFVGNLSYSVEKTDVENFFKDAGEVVDIRFSFDHEGAFKGYGHVEFASAEDAQKALELNGQDLLGRQVKLDLAKERGSYTPASGNERSSYQKGGRGQGQTIFIRGFDKSSGEAQVRSALEEHFGTCGEISSLRIPKEYGTDELKGTAYMDFADSDSFNKALELSGSELEGCSLMVEEAKPRADSRDSFAGGRSGGRSGGARGFASRDGGRGFGERGGGSGGRGYSRGRGGRDGGRSYGGRSGGGGRGRGGPSRPSMATPGTGKKTTFDD